MYLLKLEYMNYSERIIYFICLSVEFMKENPSLGDEPIDIEELVNIGKSCGP